MAAEKEANGLAENRVADHLRSGAAAPRNQQPRVSADERFKKPTRLCLSVPLHLVKRLETHADAEGMTRDKFATDLIGWAMQYRYRTRDKLLREACGVSESEPEAE